MTRLRKIYKGEENWDVLYNEQDQILTAVGKNKNKQNSNDNSQLTSPNGTKIFREDNKNSTNQSNNLNNLSNVSSNIKYNFNFNSNNKNSVNNQMNRISDKLENVAITNCMKKDLINIDNNNKDETDVQELNFNSINNDEKMPDVNDDDFDNANFDHDDDINNISMSYLSKEEDKSETGSVFKYKREKRNFGQAFGKVNENNDSLYSSISSKKMKLD